MPAKKPVRKFRKPIKSPRQKTVAKPQVWIEVRPSLMGWVIAFNETKIKGNLTKERLMSIARQMKNDIAASGGRAELVEKDREGKIIERDSGGYDPTSSKG